jgi:uncharacterized protein YkwD
MAPDVRPMRGLLAQSSHGGVARVQAACLLGVTLVSAAIIGVLMLMPQEAGASLASVSKCGGGSIEVNANEKRVLQLHNKIREDRGLKALCVQPQLTKAARAHSQEMLDKDYLSHDSFNGESVKQRLHRFGYTFGGYSYYLYGENIAGGCGSYGSPTSIFDWWMHSTDHRANILNPKYREVGIGVRTGAFKDCAQATTYTVDFGTRKQ